MTRLPSVIASSVIRSAHQGQSHGGLYLVDLETEETRQVVDWNDKSINWEGRGMDRGLRGIAFHNDNILIAASDEVFIYNTDFNILDSFRNRYLKHCHEICVFGDRLFLTSTGFDCVLEYDLVNGRFVSGQVIRADSRNPAKPDSREIRHSVFDPNGDNGPPPGDFLHINNVHYEEGNLYISALRLPVLLVLDDQGLKVCAPILTNTHNSRPLPGGRIVMNSTGANKVIITDFDGAHEMAFDIPFYDEGDLLNTHLPKDHARQGFARGLCLWGDDLIICGSSPATITVNSCSKGGRIKSINLSMDIRNAIHGLEVWPFNFTA